MLFATVKTACAVLLITAEKPSTSFDEESLQVKVVAIGHSLCFDVKLTFYFV